MVHFLSHTHSLSHSPSVTHTHTHTHTHTRTMSMINNPHGLHTCTFSIHTHMYINLPITNTQDVVIGPPLSTGRMANIWQWCTVITRKIISDQENCQFSESESYLSEMRVERERKMICGKYIRRVFVYGFPESNVFQACVNGLLDFGTDNKLTSILYPVNQFFCESKYYDQDREWHYLVNWTL